MPTAAKTLSQIKNATPKPDNRPSAAKRGYGPRWKKVRILQLTQEPLCCICIDDGRTVQATVVDHIVPHKGDQALMWDGNNHQSLCKSCHDRKTATEDGGFGHKRKGSK